jgi:hypothetical protein
MAYTASTVGATATPAKTFMETLKPLLEAGGFTFVETWTSGNITAEIYLSPSASNGVGDWYLLVHRATDASTSVRFCPFEIWNAGAKTMQGYAPDTFGVPDANFRYNATSAISTNLWHQYNWVGLGASGFSFWTSINAQRIVVATRVSTTDYCCYTGLYDDLLPASLQMMPLVGGLLNYNNPNGGSRHTTLAACTREPGQTVTNNGNFGAAFGQNYTYLNGAADPYLGNKYPTARVHLQTSRSDKSLGVRGLLKDIIATYAGSAAINGDNLIVTMQDGSTKDYFRVKHSSSSLYWCDKAA